MHPGYAMSRDRIRHTACSQLALQIRRADGLCVLLKGIAMKKIIKKLALNKETVRSLREADLAIMQGGKPKETVMTRCDGDCDQTQACDTSRLVICGC
jgi:hypothetical protein